MTAMRGRLLIALAALGLLAAADMPGDEATNRRLLKLWQSDAAHMDRLRQYHQAYLGLPADQQDRLRKFDKELHDLEAAERDRLRAVMERYAGWRSRLDPASRERLDAAPPGPDRAKVVTELLDRQWQESLSKADKERLAKATADERTKLLEQLRKEERDRRELRAAARRAADDAAQFGPLGIRIEDFRERVTVYVDETLRPLASASEEARINNLLRLNPVRWLQNVHEIAQRHPPLPFPAPGVPTVGVTPNRRKALRAIKDLPIEWQGKFALPLPKPLADVEGKWPDFPIALAAEARKRNISLPAQLLGPTKPDELPPGLKKFVNDMSGKLTDEERGQLAAAEGQWPEYPRKIRELAERHRLVVPGLTLPGTTDQWTLILNSKPFRPGKAANN